LRAAALEAFARRAGVYRTVCGYVPRELVEALGIDAPRLLSPGTVESESRGEARSGAGTCSWCKSALGSESAGLTWIGGATCDQMRRALELSGRANGSEPIVIHVPKTRTAEAEELYVGELRRLAVELERRTGRALGDASLRQAIETRGAIRNRIREVRPGLSGSDFAALIHLESLLPPGAMMDLLDRETLPTGDLSGIHVLVAGSPHSPADLRWLDLVEESGFSVVADATCTGDRAIAFDVGLEEGTDPIEALGRAYFRRPPCPFVRPNDEFYAWVNALAARSEARAVIWRSVRGCDIHSLEVPRAERIIGLPLLALDMTYGDVDSVRIRTRVEAFAECLR